MKIPKATTMTFSNFNMDIAELLAKKKEEGHFKQTDYICECIRFYEKYKDQVVESLGVPNSTQANIDINALKEMISQTIDEKIGSLDKPKKEVDNLENNLGVCNDFLDED